MKPYYQDERVTILHGDCLDVLRSLPDASVDSVVTDPPYDLTNRTPDVLGCVACGRTLGGRDGTPDVCPRCGGDLSRQRSAQQKGFMGKEWDGTGIAFRPDVWVECLRVLKPGGHLLSFGGTRTWHRLACAVEDAGFEVRDSIAWLYGSGFPKSLDVSKAIDKAAGAEREVVGLSPFANRGRVPSGSQVDVGRSEDSLITAPATPEAERWQGWGTALKPSHEPVVVARKPAGPTAVLDTIGSQLGALEEACRRRVSGAARSSARTRADSSVARTATAPASAATPHEDGQEPITPTGAAASSSAATVTSASEWTAETFLSTVTSWRECLAEIYEATSMSTTSTATSRTTDLQTLSSCLSSIMQSVTAQSILDPRSWSSLATAADNLFAAGVLSSRSTLALSVIESATSATPEDSPPAAGSPAFEPVVVARKPLTGTVAANVLQHGTGALNIDACRVGDGEDRTNGGATGKRVDAEAGYMGGWADAADGRQRPTGGRWPTNVVLDDSQAAELDEQSGERPTQATRNNPTRESEGGIFGLTAKGERSNPGAGETGGASRFFPTFRYEAKAPTSERPRYKREGVVGGESVVAHPT